MPAPREVIFLGTASQVPTRARGHNSLFLRWDDLGILFDPGEGTQRQMIMAGLSASQITHIAITHFHGDHCLGLASMLQRISLDEVHHPVHIVYPESGQAFFDRQRYASIYHERSTLVLHPMPQRPLASGLQVAWERKGLRLLCGPLDHRVECIGYRLEEADGRRMLPERLAAAGVHGPFVRALLDAGELSVEGRLVTVEEVSELRRGQAFALLMDTRPCDGALTLAHAADLVVAESTYLDSEREEAHAHAHMTASQAATIAQQAGARRLVLTHFSQRYQSLEPFAQEAGAIFSEVVVAKDLLRVSVPKEALPDGA